MSSDAQALEVRAIDSHLLGFAQLQLIEVARRPAIGHVHEQDLGLRERRELTHVGEDRAIGRRVLDGNEDPAIHDRLSEKRLVEQPDVQCRNDNGDRPRQRLNPSRRDEDAHLAGDCS